MSPSSLATIGVYGFDAGTFLGALEEAEVGVLIDVRQRGDDRHGEGKRSRTPRLAIGP